LGRYALSRRPHPWFAQTKSLLGSIQAERVALESVRDLADEVIDTSTLSSKQLRHKLEALVLETLPEVPITVMSFGFKHGLPKDAQFALDIRFLPNPFYLEALRPLSGLDAPVRDYVMAGNQAQETYSHLLGMLQFLLAQYCQDRRSQLLIAIGCTGGQHRSVAFVERLAVDLRQEGFQCDAIHRDLKPHPTQESPP
jgi:RNase adapter protein RapZ